MLVSTTATLRLMQGRRRRQFATVAQVSTPQVIAVHRSADHTFAKYQEESIELRAGLGVVDDAHFGAEVRHRSRVRVDPRQPNLRQVHLIQSELFDDVAEHGFVVNPGELGENITTRGLDLMMLAVGTTLRIGSSALVALTGLRNPCPQINGHAEGLQGHLRARDDDGELVLRGGVMGVVVFGGMVASMDEIVVALPPLPHHPMQRI